MEFPQNNHETISFRNPVEESKHNNSQNIDIVSEEPLEPIDLLNFDPFTRIFPVFNSPRSVEALKSLGIEDHELLCKDKKDFENDPIPKQFLKDKEEFIKLRMSHYEKARQNRLKQCIEAREKLIRAPQSIFENFDSKRSILGAIDYQKRSVELSRDHGQKMIDTLVRKKEAELVEIELSDRKRAETDAKLLNHSLKVKEFEIKRQEDTEKKRRELEEEASKRKLIKMLENRQAEFQNQELLNVMSKKDQEIREKKKIQEIKRAEEQALREQKRKEKSEQVIKTYLESEKKKLEIAEMRKAIIDQKAQVATSAIEIKKEEKASQSRKAREDFKRKYQQMKWMEDEKRELSANRLLERLMKSDENRLKIEEQKLHELEARKTQYESKSREIKTAVERRSLINDEFRRSALQEKQERAESLRRRVLEEKEQERLAKIKILEERQESAKIRISSQQAAKEMIAFEAYNRLQESFERAEENKKKIDENKRLTRMIDYIKEEEAKVNLTRQERMKHYQEEKIRKRLEYHSAKMEVFQQEHMNIKKEREEVQKQYNSKYENLKNLYETEIKKNKFRSTSRSPRNYSSGNYLSPNNRSGYTSNAANNEDFHSKSHVIHESERSTSPTKILEASQSKSKQITPKAVTPKKNYPTSPILKKPMSQQKNQSASPYLKSSDILESNSNKSAVKKRENTSPSPLRSNNTSGLRPSIGLFPKLSISDSTSKKSLPWEDEPIKGEGYVISLLNKKINREFLYLLDKELYNRNGNIIDAANRLYALGKYNLLIPFNPFRAEDLEFAVTIKQIDYLGLNDNKKK